MTTSAAASDIDILLDRFRAMLVIRLTEEELARSHTRGLVHGACHTYVGQEAVAVGVCGHLSKSDTVFSTHRGHGHALAKGMPPADLCAELFGRAAGCSRGRGGSMHLFAPEIGMMGTSGIVGPCILQACGAGYAAKLQKTGAVAVAFFGDGAVNNAAFHEGLNMAAIWKLPVLFVCENNGFATEVPFSYSSGIPEVGRRAASYGLAGVELDGNDVVAVHAAAREAVERARGGDGATLLECRTYRTRAHSEGMGDFTYRTREEVDAWKQRCPIARLRGVLGQLGVLEGDLAAIEADVQAVVTRARAAAEASPPPAPATAVEDVYAVTEPSGPVPPQAHGVNSEGPPRTWAQGTLQALDEAMAADPSIFVMGEGIGVRGGNFATTTGLFAKYGPERLCDTPICERGFVGLACGAAMAGARPVIDFMFADFVLDSAGEIINQIAKMRYMSSGRLRMPVILRGCIGIGHCAATHHSGSYYGMYAQVPGLRVVVPSNAADAKGLFTHALRGSDPVLFLEHRELMGHKTPVPDGLYDIPFGVANVVRRGRHVTVVALARMVQLVASVCDQLAAEGIDVELIDPRTVSPLDMATILASVERTGRLLVVDEPPASCGFSAEVAARVADEGFDFLDAPVRRLTGAFVPTPYAPSLEAVVVPNADDCLAAIRAIVAE